MKLLLILVLSLFSISALAQTPQQLNLPNGLGAMSMAQDQNGTVYIEQGDANWYVFLGWSLTLVGSPQPIFAPAGPLDVPTVIGPFVPSSDGTTITAPNGTVTSLAGKWTWGALDTGTDYFLLLNGAQIGHPPFQLSATTLTINAQGNAFYSNARTGSQKLFMTYADGGAGGAPTSGPIPVGARFVPSYYSGFSSCPFPVGVSPTCVPAFSLAAHNTAGDNHAGTLISTITVTMSDGSPFAGTIALFQPQSNPFQIVGNQLQLARALVTADEGAVTGGPLFAFIEPSQNGVTLGGGWIQANIDVNP